MKTWKQCIELFRHYKRDRSDFVSNELHSSVRRLLVTASVVPSSRILVTVMK
jgi:hypothetical protein